MLPVCNPWFERIGIVVNMIDNKAGTGKCTSHDGKKIDEKGCSAGNDCRSTIVGDNFSPSGSWRLKQTIVHRIVVSADCESEPSLQFIDRN